MHALTWKLVASWSFLLGIVCVLLSTSCSQDQPQRQNAAGVQDNGRQVVVGDPIMFSALQGILPESERDCELMCPEVDPQGGLTRQQALEIQSSGLIILDGTHSSSSWSDTIALPQSRTVHSTFDILDDLIYVPNLSSHSHGPGQAHSHGGVVPQTWLDPQLFQQQLQMVLETMQTKQFVNAEGVVKALGSWKSATADVNRQIDELRSQQPIAVLVDRVGTEYLCRRLNWQPEVKDFHSEAASDRQQLETWLKQWRKTNPEGRILLTRTPDARLLQLLEPLKIVPLQISLTPQDYRWDRYVNSLQQFLGQCRP